MRTITGPYKQSSPRAMIIVIFMAIAVCVLSCTDKDNPSGPQYVNDRLDGTFLYGVYDHANTVHFGTMDFDGEGNGTYEHLVSSDSPLESGSGVYTVQTDGRFSFGNNSHGMTDANGTIASAVEIYDGDNNIIMVIMKSSSGMTTASLNGDYYLVSYTFGNSVVFASVSFDGDGNTEYEILDGTEPLESSVGTYAVQSNGRVAIDDDVHCITDPMGSIIAGIGLHSGDDNEIMMLIKQSSGMTAADVSGEYYLTSYMNGNSVVFAKIVFDGDHTATYTVLEDSDGSSDTGVADYTVSSDGKFTIDDTMVGVVSSDGQVMAAIEMHDGEDNAIFFMIKK